MSQGRSSITGDQAKLTVGWRYRANKDTLMIEWAAHEDGPDFDPANVR
jgi:hypothetical protein